MKMDTVQDAVDNRQTDDIIVVVFQNWEEKILYDSRKTWADVPLALADYPVETIHIVDGLTIVEI